MITNNVYRDLPSPERIAGDNRFETAARVKTTFYPNATKSYMATGYGFADALAGSVLAAKDGAPMLLVKQDELPKETSEVISGVTEINLLGGQAAISDKVKNLLYK